MKTTSEDVFTIFSNNLRKHCMQKISIAHVCRESGINRQQFNKYLSGQSLPSARNFRKICDFFQINESDLLNKNTDVPARYTPSHKTVENISRELDRLNRLLPFNIKSVSTQQNTLLELGLYYCFFPMPNFEQQVVRSVIKIWQVGDHLFFSRITAFPFSNSAGRSVRRGRHNGIVLLTQENASFIGANKSAPYQISFINLDLKTKFDAFFGGQAITRGTVNSIACPVAFEKLPENFGLRKALKSLTALNLNDPQVPEYVRFILSPRSPAF